MSKMFWGEQFKMTDQQPTIEMSLEEIERNKAWFGISKLLDRVIALLHKENKKIKKS